MEKKVRQVEYTIGEFAQLESQYRVACRAYQTAKAEAEIVKEMSKDVLAQEMKRADTPNVKRSAVELERMARNSDEWSEFREGQWAAIREESEKKAEMVAAKTAWDTVQSGLSYLKEEMKMRNHG